MDPMMQAFQSFQNKFTNDDPPTELQCFQAGYSASAASMRSRAQAAVAAALATLTLPQGTKDVVTNTLVNAVGVLPDIW